MNYVVSYYFQMKKVYETFDDYKDAFDFMIEKANIYTYTYLYQGSEYGRILDWR